MRAWFVAVASIAVVSVLIAPASFAQEQEHHPRGYVRVQGWQADVDEDGVREGGALRTRIDLSEDLRLDVLDLARMRRWHKLTLASPDGGDRHRIVFQGATGWTRAMRLLLSGR